jgi:hypothetical protein
LQVFNGIVFQISPPDILNSIAKTEVHVFCDLDALNATFVSCIVLWMVDRIVHQPLHASITPMAIMLKIVMIAEMISCFI